MMVVTVGVAGGGSECGSGGGFRFCSGFFMVGF